MAILRDDPAGGSGARITSGALWTNQTPLVSTPGFVPVVFYASFTAATTEALVTLTPYRDWVAGATGTSFTVTSAKRLRLTSLSVSTKNAGAAGQGVAVTVRLNPSGVATATSPPVAQAAAGTALAIAGVTAFGEEDIHVVDIAGSAQIGVSQIGTATAGNVVFVRGYEYTP